MDEVDAGSLTGKHLKQQIQTSQVDAISTQL